MYQVALTVPNMPYLYIVCKRDIYNLMSLYGQQRNVLVTVGDDDQASSQSSAICLKVFDLDEVQEEGSSSTTPFCVQILRIFTNQFPQAKVKFSVTAVAGHIRCSSATKKEKNIY
jgi:hypothetical protein